MRWRRPAAQAKAARLLGLTPRQIGYALRKHGVEMKHPDVRHAMSQARQNVRPATLATSFLPDNSN